MKKIKKFLGFLGPGAITGAADDDPSGIATYAQAGARFGYGQLWTAVFMLPFQISVQEACARIGAVTGKGIAAVIKTHFDKKILYLVVGLVLIANTINIGADIGAMAEATKLIVPMPFVILVIIFTVSILTLEIFTSYKVYSKMLKWLVLSLLAYPLTVFIVREPWAQLIKTTFIPNIKINFEFFFLITGVFGTTITPYMFFWEASEEVEEERENGILSRFRKPRLNPNFIKKLRIDNFLGMFLSEIGTWSIIAVSATVLFTHGITNINTAADAAKALEPLVKSFPNAGYIAKAIFAIGIVGLGFLSVPVLAGSGAYALSEAFEWKEGLYRKLRQAHGFYGVITLAILVSLIINFIGIDPMKMLVYTAVINGVVAIPLIFLIGRIAQNGKIMGEYKSKWLSKTILFLTFIFMSLAGAVMFITFFLPK